MFDAIVVDLDGTLVDCAARHYACYLSACAELGAPHLPAQAYWQMKRRHAPWPDIFSEAGAQMDPARAEKAFLALIEAPEYLQLDTLYGDSLRALTELKKKASRLVLVTMRRRRDGMMRQLADLNIAGFFDGIGCRGDAELESKAAIARNALPATARTIAWIGDTEEDILAARAIGALECAVHRGLRDRQYLEKREPDLLCENLAELVTLLR